MTQNNRIWMIGTITVMLVIVVAGWFLGAQPFIAAAAAADQQTADVTAQNAAQTAEIAQLTTEMKQLPQLEKDYKTLQASIPATSNTADFIKGLDALATAAGVQIVGFTVGDPLAYTIPASAAVAAPAASPAPSATPTPAPPVVVSTAPAVATNPLITPDNFVGIQVVIDVAGPNANVLNFLNGLQSGTRLYLVTAITSTRDVALAVGTNPDGQAVAADPNAVTTHVTGYIYVIKNEG
ncbi:MAG: hypothetical protein JWP19_1456 [Rhodoglobus sp.]|nr:hypothetical protein [Rhodoglobus sp.]